MRISVVTAFVLLSIAISRQASANQSSSPGLAVKDGGAVSGLYCGIYSMYGALSAIGIDVEIGDLLRPRYIRDVGGSTAQDLCRAAKANGANATFMSGIGLSGLEAASTPLILHVSSGSQLQRFSHWVLFLGMEDGNARILDPTDGSNSVRLQTPAEVLLRWDGAAIAVSNAGDRAVLPWFSEYLSALFLLGIAIGFFLLLYLLQGRDGLVSLGKMSAGVQVSALLFVSAAFGFIFNLCSPSGLLADQNARRFVVAATVDTYFDDIAKSDFDAAIDRGNVIVIDARLKRDFDRGHIGEARSLPVNSTNSEIRSFANTIEPGCDVLIYCQSSGCPYSDSIAIKLSQHVINNIKIFRGGWVDWRTGEMQ